MNGDDDITKNDDNLDDIGGTLVFLLTGRCDID
jgi:hypothetical protein